MGRKSNLELQRENHGLACAALGISNPHVPKLPEMRIHCSFRFWQPVAIHALREFVLSALSHNLVQKRYQWYLREVAAGRLELPLKTRCHFGDPISAY